MGGAIHRREGSEPTTAGPEAHRSAPGSARGDRDEGGGAALGSPLHSDQAASRGDAAAAAAATATDLGWLSEEQLEAMGLASGEDVVKSTSMVRDESLVGGETKFWKGEEVRLDTYHNMRVCVCVCFCSIIMHGRVVHTLRYRDRLTLAFLRVATSDRVSRAPPGCR